MKRRAKELEKAAESVPEQGGSSQVKESISKKQRWVNDTLEIYFKYSIITSILNARFHWGKTSAYFRQLLNLEWLSLSHQCVNIHFSIGYRGPRSSPCYSIQTPSAKSSTRDLRSRGKLRSSDRKGSRRMRSAGGSSTRSLASWTGLSCLLIQIFMTSWTIMNG